MKMSRRIYLGENFIYRWADGGGKAITMHPNAGLLKRGRDGKLETDVCFELVDGRDPEVINEAVIKSSCGQEMTLNLNEIGKGQPINEVTIRGVKYVPQ